ncbi:MAG: hypothetical protein WAU24_13055, partial [Chitinophagaceae bacterium]
MQKFSINRFFKKNSTSFLAFVLFILSAPAFAQKGLPVLHYTLSFPEPATHSYQVQLQCSGWNKDTIFLKMP